MSTSPMPASSIIRPCLVLMAVFTVLTGVLYPLAITAAAQVAFPSQANGSLIVDHGQVIGSQLIAQPFEGPGWFWPRASAAAYNGANSSGANLAPVVDPQRQAWSDRTALLRTSGITGTVPADLVTSSGSGLDPHLSPEAALIQVPRIATARNLDAERLRQLVIRHTEPPQLGVLGAARVNVLELNRAVATMATGGH